MASAVSQAVAQSRDLRDFKAALANYGSAWQAALPLDYGLYDWSGSEWVLVASADAKVLRFDGAPTVREYSVRWRTEYGFGSHYALYITSPAGWTYTRIASSSFDWMDHDGAETNVMVSLPPWAYEYSGNDVESRQVWRTPVGTQVQETHTFAPTTVTHSIDAGGHSLTRTYRVPSYSPYYHQILEQSPAQLTTTFDGKTRKLEHVRLREDCPFPEQKIVESFPDTRELSLGDVFPN